jgi:hypothetical protein
MVSLAKDRGGKGTNRIVAINRLCWHIRPLLGVRHLEVPIVVLIGIQNVFEHEFMIVVEARAERR